MHQYIMDYFQTLAFMVGIGLLMWFTLAIMGYGCAIIANWNIIWHELILPKILGKKVGSIADLFRKT